MTNLTGNFERYVTVDNCSDLAVCVYCRNYQSPLKTNQRGQIVCKDFVECVWNRVENGDMTEERASALLNRGGK